jgi:hypothetical protein
MHVGVRNMECLYGPHLCPQIIVLQHTQKQEH